MLNAPDQNMNQELINASFFGNLVRVNEMLKIAAVRDIADAGDNRALGMAAFNGHLAVVNRLLEIPAVINYAAPGYNDILRFAAQNGHLAVVNRLLEIPDVLANASALDNSALNMAVDGYHLETACRLLKVPNVRAHLENGPRENFLAFFKLILEKIQENAYFTFEYDENCNVVSTHYGRGPLDAEINIVDILRDIGRKYKLSATDFSQEDFGILKFARRVDDSLHFSLSTHTSLTTMLMTALAPAKKHFDPAAPATSAGTPSILPEDDSNDETDPSMPGPSQPRRRP